MKHKAVFILASVFFFSTVGPSISQDDDVEGASKDPNKPDVENVKVKGSDLDLDVPVSPAFTVLGLTPDTVVRPAAPRNLAVSILDGTDRNGNMQAGIAIDFSPYMLFSGEDVTLTEYQSEAWNGTKRILARTQLSFATAKGVENDNAIKIGLGVRVPLLDGGDPRMDREFMSCLTNKFKHLPEQTAPSGDTFEERQRVANEQDRVRKEYYVVHKDENVQIFENCKSASRKRMWNKMAWDVGLAPAFTSGNGEFGDLEWSGAAVWTSFSFGFGADSDASESDKPALPNFEEGIIGLVDFAQTAVGNAQVILHARYRFDEDVPVAGGSKQTFDQDSIFLAAKLRMGGPSTTVSFEGAYINENKGGGQKNDQFAQYSGTVAFRVSENTWVNLSFGTTDGRDKDENVFALGGLKYAFTTATSGGVFK